MPFYCPECGKTLKSNYSIVRDITTVDHGKPTNCEGVGQKGVYDHEMSKNQKKNMERVAGTAAAKLHKEEKSVSNLNSYQTPLKNRGDQLERENNARTLGLKGHASANSNSKQNFGTTKGLNAINKK
jgi:spore germination protein GerM